MPILVTLLCDDCSPVFTSFPPGTGSGLWLPRSNSGDITPNDVGKEFAETFALPCRCCA